MSLNLSISEEHLLNTPFKDLSPSQRSDAFSLSDRISEHNRSQPYSASGKVIIQDKDILLKDGVISPLDQQTSFHNRREWNDHLKRNGCVEIGNDYNNSTKKSREIRGDFDCREELGKVTHQVMEKYGH